MIWGEGYRGDMGGRGIEVIWGEGYRGDMGGGV